jgi:RNA polymerase sigma-70 factor (ECF subfamily)
MPDDLAPDQHSSLDEAVLAERARARDPEAWTVIYERHYQPIFRYIHARVFDRDMATDLASGVFTSALGGIGNYQYTGRPILAWLYRIARNSVADHHRRTLGRRGIEKVSAPLRAVAGVFRQSPGSTPATATWEPEELAERLDLHRAVAALPESQREVLILRFLVGLSTEEISEIVGKERAAVYSLHARAINSLREALSGSAPAAARRTSPIRDKSTHPGTINMMRGKKS